MKIEMLCENCKQPLSDCREDCEKEIWNYTTGTSGQLCWALTRDKTYKCATKMRSDVIHKEAPRGPVQRSCDPKRMLEGPASATAKMVFSVCATCSSSPCDCSLQIWNYQVYGPDGAVTGWGCKEPRSRDVAVRRRNKTVGSGNVVRVCATRMLPLGGPAPMVQIHDGTVLKPELTEERLARCLFETDEKPYGVLTDAMVLAEIDGADPMDVAQAAHLQKILDILWAGKNEEGPHRPKERWAAEDLAEKVFEVWNRRSGQ